MPIIVIPARFASTRYPGKPLVMLRGADGTPKSLIHRAIEAARAVPQVARILVATDDSRIAEAAQAVGAEVAMTSESCRNGTERCAEVARALGADLGADEVIVNLQGDAPLTPPDFLYSLIDAMQDPDCRMATPVLRCDGAAHGALLDDRAAGRVGGTTAVFGANHRALYFSKEVIPHTAERFAPDAPTPVWHHVGVYAYRPDALAAYAGWPEGALERLEGLEQLRFLEHGVPITCVPVEGRGRAFWELNNPEDVPRIEAMLAQRGIA